MDRAIRIEREYDYSPEQVWVALTQPRAVSAWLMATDIEPIVGFKFQFRAKPQPGWRGIVDCEVIEAVPGRRLVYKWQGAPRSKPTTITWTLEPTSRGTRLILEQVGFEGIGGWFMRMMMAQGWRKMLSAANLQKVLKAVSEGQIESLVPRFKPTRPHS